MIELLPRPAALESNLALAWAIHSAQEYDRKLVSEQANDSSPPECNPLYDDFDGIELPDTAPEFEWLPFAELGLGKREYARSMSAALTSVAGDLEVEHFLFLPTFTGCRWIDGTAASRDETAAIGYMESHGVEERFTGGIKVSDDHLHRFLHHYLPTAPAESRRHRRVRSLERTDVLLRALQR